MSLGFENHKVMRGNDGTPSTHYGMTVEDIESIMNKTKELFKFKCEQCGKETEWLEPSDGFTPHKELEGWEFLSLNLQMSPKNYCSKQCIVDDVNGVEPVSMEELDKWRGKGNGLLSYYLDELRKHNNRPSLLKRVKQWGKRYELELKLSASLLIVIALTLILIMRNL